MHHWIPSCGNAFRISSLTVILKQVSLHNRGIHEQRVKSRSFNKCAINYSCIRLYIALTVNIIVLNNMGRHIYDGRTKSSHTNFGACSEFMYYNLMNVADDYTAL